MEVNPDYKAVHVMPVDSHVFMLSSGKEVLIEGGKEVDATTRDSGDIAGSLLQPCSLSYLIAKLWEVSTRLSGSCWKIHWLIW